MSVRKAQNIMEYTILFCIVLAALLIMQVYIKRSYQGRLKLESDSIGPQYSVGHTTSETVSTTESETTSYVGGITESGIRVPTGVSYTESKSKATMTKEEEVDSFVEEDFNP